MFEVYVQVGNAAEIYRSFRRFGDQERFFCQRLSNRCKAAVRVLRAERLVADFHPHRVECSEGC